MNNEQALLENQSLNNSSQNTEFSFKPNSIDLGGMIDEPRQNAKMQVSMPSANVSRNEEALKPVKEEAKGLLTISKNQEEIDEHYQRTMDKDWGFVERITNRSMYNEVQKAKAELFNTSAKYRLAFYKTILDTRLENLNEHCNAGLKMVKGHYRQQVSTFLMSKMEQLSFEVRDRQISFLEMMKGKYQYAETLGSYPTMQQRYQNSIFSEEEKYLRFLDGLLDKFQSIVDEELRKYN